MSKQLLTEFFELCPNGRCLDMLSERQKREVVEEGAVYLTGRIQTAGKKNGNGRVYPRKVLEKEIANYQKIIKDNKNINFRRLIFEKGVSKISIVGVGMVSTPGVTFRMFQSLADERISFEVLRNIFSNLRRKNDN